MSAELVLPAVLDSRVTWPGWVTLLGKLRPGETASRTAATVETDALPARPAWRPVVGLPPAPTPAVVLPDLPHPRFKIQCVPLEPASALNDNVRTECEQQAAVGGRLVSTFTHDGHVFLVFKRP